MQNLLPKLGVDGRILEGIVTTRNEDDTVNISPMGPIVDASLTQFIFRPYRTSTTYQNLKRTSHGVFHVTDDVLLFAQAALGQPDPLPSLDGLVLIDACRWYAFEIKSLDDSQERTEIVANTVKSGCNRDFLGFNRAKHAVLEAAILATRVHLLPAADIRAELKRLESPLQKTASSEEKKAFAFLCNAIYHKIEQPA
ncbi:MAG: DUF447 family protein [Planctomycetes bacterium]|nr:DUF447 family protein [Planctomycetota bacterium]